MFSLHVFSEAQKIVSQILRLSSLLVKHNDSYETTVVPVTYSFFFLQLQSVDSSIQQQLSVI